jgi:hypothetical protein
MATVSALLPTFTRRRVQAGEVADARQGFLA